MFLKRPPEPMMTKFTDAQQALLSLELSWHADDDCFKQCGEGKTFMTFIHLLFHNYIIAIMTLETSNLQGLIGSTPVSIPGP